MSTPLTPFDPATLKINCHDPRGYPPFLQLSRDLQHWKMHSDDQSWWFEREKQCIHLFQHYGYDLQSGMWYCLIACQRNGWNGISRASQLLANGFSRQQMVCWPPLAAIGLRRQILENYTRQLVPLIYALPMAAVNVQVLQKQLSASQHLQQHATALNSPVMASFFQLNSWLESRIHTLEQQTIAPAPAPARILTTDFLPEPPGMMLASDPIKSAWPGRLVCGSAGAGLVLCVMLAIQSLGSPRVLQASQTFWPNNPLVSVWQAQHQTIGESYVPNHSTRQIAEQLDVLEQRLLGAEQKRTPYLTISELKTVIYQLRQSLDQQSSFVENRLERLLRQQPLSPADVFMLTSQIDALKSRLILLQHAAQAPQADEKMSP